MSVFVSQQAVALDFRGKESWVILSQIEKGIRDKIESVGRPLKEWSIEIYRGILTGYNEAFIIDSATRKKLIDGDPKSAEIIRPILRGRDVRRFSYTFADLYVISTFPSLKIEIDDYPAVKAHLLSFGYDRLKQTGENGSRKRTSNKWFETQDSIGYWEDFLRPKIIYPDIMRMPSQNALLPEYPYFYLDQEGFFAEATNFILCGDDLDVLCAYLASSPGFFSFAKFYTGPQFDDTGFRYKKDYLQNLVIPDFSLFDIPRLRNIFTAATSKTAEINKHDQYSQIDKIFMEGMGLTSDEVAYIVAFKESLIA